MLFLAIVFLSICGQAFPNVVLLRSGIVKLYADGTGTINSPSLFLNNQSVLSDLDSLVENSNFLESTINSLSTKFDDKFYQTVKGPSGFLGIVGTVFFSVGGEDFVAGIANSNGLNPDRGEIWKWNTTSFTFVLFQDLNVSTSHPTSVTYYIQDGDSYLIFSSESIISKSYIFKYDPVGKLFNFDRILTLGPQALDWVFFTQNGGNYLARSTGPDSDHAEIYKYDTDFDSWDMVVELNGRTAELSPDIEYFVIDETQYLAVAVNQDDTSGKAYGVDIFEIDTEAGSLDPVISIDITGASHCTYFSIEEEHYLAVTSDGDTSTDYESLSYILKWNGNTFEEYQTFATSGAKDADIFTLAEDYYMLVANYRDNGDFSTNSVLYKWSGQEFVPISYIPTQRATGWTAFRINGNPYALLATDESAGTLYLLD